VETEVPEENMEVGHLRVLVVDDQEVICELIAEMVRAQGHFAETVLDGPAALVALKHGQWDVMLSDQSMPEMTGAELAAEARSRGCSLPVILLTGFGDEMRAQGGSPPGVDLIVSKPLTAKGLREALKAVTG
jgi:CheY-like chemotaxis protein